MTASRSSGRGRLGRLSRLQGPWRLLALVLLVGAWALTDRGREVPPAEAGAAPPRAAEVDATAGSVRHPGMPGAEFGVDAPAGQEEAPAGQEETRAQAGGGGHEEPGAPGQEAHAGEDEGAAGLDEGAGHGLDPSHFFLVLIAILLFAKLLGEAAERIGQPSVLGELIAGVVLGGSVLGIVPVEGAWGLWDPATGASLAEMIHVLAEVGVAILLFEIGLETDLKEMFNVGPASAGVAAVGVILPFLLGFVYWYWADPDIGTHLPGIDLTMVAIFVGATLTATSVGITARVLTDLKMMHRSESRVIIGAAVIDDVLGLVILAIVAGMAAGEGVTALGITKTFTIAVGFLVLAVIIGNWVAPKLFDLVDRMSVRGMLLVSALSFALLIAALADLAGSAMIIGAFAAGIVLSTTNQFDLIVERIEPVADVFTPIFFVSVGAAVNINLFNPLHEIFNADVIVVGLILILVAVIGKVVAGYVVGWGEEKMNHLAIGIGMVPRGEVGLIFADIGRRGGILSNETFSAILIMVIVTTFIAPPLLKIVFKPTEEDVPPHLPSRKPPIQSTEGLK